MSTIHGEFELEERLRKPSRGEPVWPLARQFPMQGAWTAEDYLALETEGIVEYVDGCLEFPPMPTKTHARIQRFIARLLERQVDDRRLGETFTSGYPVRVHADAFRQPDVVCILNRHADQAGEQFATAADLVVEVVSPSDPGHDWITKKAEYATAGIPEYWIADPRNRTLTVFTLDDGASEYREAGRYGEGETANSVLLDGLTANVTAVFTAE